MFTKNTMGAFCAAFFIAPGQLYAAAPPGFAAITPDQKNAIAQNFEQLQSSEQLKKLITEAKPAIETFVERIACLNSSAGASALNQFSAPRANLDNIYRMLNPMRSAKYHDKSTCMTVARIHGWEVPADNALKFEVIYKADDSGETKKIKHEAVRQPDGVWLFKK